MTDRLTTLLHSEVDDLRLPPPPTRAVLERGRTLRRRRQVSTALTATAAAVAMGTALLLSLPGGRSNTAPEPTSPPADLAAFAVGSDLYVGGERTALPSTVHSLHFTSAGVLVRSNPNGGSSDGSGPETLTLVTTDGRTVDLGEVPEGHGPATDPDLPYYVLAEADGDATYAVVRDVVSGDVVERLELPDLDPGGWSVPPLALSGRTVYARFGSTTIAVDTRTGATEETSADALSVRGGRFADTSGDRRVVRDARTGATLLEVPMPAGSHGWLDLSPEGDYALRFIEELADGAEITESRVYDVSAGTSVTIQGAPWDLGWTPDGHVFRVDGDVVTTCSPVTGRCTEEQVSIERERVPEPVERTETVCDRNGENCGTSVWTDAGQDPNRVVLGGRTYES